MKMTTGSIIFMFPFISVLAPPIYPLLLASHTNTHSFKASGKCCCALFFSLMNYI